MAEFCKAIIKITYYDKDAKGWKTIPYEVNSLVEYDEDVTLESITNNILSLSEDSRKELWRYILTSKVSKLTNDDIISGRTIVSNVDLDTIKDRYPSITFDLGDVSILDNFLLVFCTDMQLNNVQYFGRTIDSKGREIFFLNGYQGVAKFTKYLEARTKIGSLFEGNNLKEEFQEFKTDLEFLKDYYKKDTLLDLILDFLNDVDSYKIFKHEDKAINPRRILHKFLNRAVGSYDPDNRKSDLRILLESNWEQTKVDYHYKISLSKLYKVLETMSLVEDITKEQFLQLENDKLLEFINTVFSRDVKLIKSRITKIGKEKDKENTAHEIFKGITGEVKEKYKELKKQNKEKYKKTFDKLSKDELLEILSVLKYLDVSIEKNDKEKFIINLKVTKEATTKEGDKYIILSFPWLSLKDVYGFGYEKSYMFSPVTEKIKNENGSEITIVDKGKYNGAYIYEYFDSKSLQTHYAISRNIINPYNYAATYSTLEDAKRKIDYWNRTQSINREGLWTIRQQKNRPRKVKVEQSGLKEGQLITMHDYKIPTVNFGKLESEILDLFNSSVNNLQQYFLSHNVDNITKIDSPELASAFILNLYGEWKSAKIVSWYDFLKSYNISELIENIVNSDIVSYYVEKTYGDIAVLKYLHNNGNKVLVEGNVINAKDEVSVITLPLNSDMEKAIEYFENTLGIKVHTHPSIDDFKTFIKNKGIEIDDINKVRAFVYDGEIYINTYNANLQNLFHEMAHILIGVMKHKNPELYQNIVKKYLDVATRKNLNYNAFNKKLKYIASIYKNFSEEDLIEETVADLIADDLYNKGYLIDEFKDSDFENDLKLLFNFKEVASPKGTHSLSFGTIKDSIKDSKNSNIERMKISYLISKGVILQLCN